MRIYVHTYADLLTRSGHRLTDLDLPAGATVADALAAAAQAGGAAVLVNGSPAEPGRVLEPGDEIHAGPGYGDPGNIALFVIALLAAAASAVIAGSMGVPKGSEGTDEERRYGFNRFSNDARAGEPVPVVYGRRPAYGGKVIARVPIESPDGSGDSRLKVLICFGHGPIAGIGNRETAFDDVPAADVEGVYLNDQAIRDFAGVRLSGRMGTTDQRPIRDFADAETLRDVGVGGSELRNTSGADRSDPEDDEEAVGYTTVDEVDAIRIRIRFPSGLYALTTGSQLEPRVLRYRVRFREAGGDTWGQWRNYFVSQAQQSEFFASPRIEFDARARYEFQVQRVTAEVEDSDPTVQDKALWDSVIEIVDGDYAYPGMALLSLEITANEQIQTIPRVSADVRGRLVRTYTGGGPTDPQFEDAWSDNPAEVALDLLTNPVYGLGSIYGSDRVDWTSWIEWRDYCAEEVTHPNGATTRRFGFSFALDQHRDGIEWLRTVCLAGRAIPATVGGTWRFVAQRPQDTPVEVFTDGSIAQDESGLAMITYRRELATGGVVRPNQLQLQFENASQRGEPDVATYPHQGTLWLADETPRVASDRVDGVVIPEQVMAEAVYRMRRTRLQTRTVSFVTTRPAVVVQPGERFDLASSLPGYATASGTVRHGSTPDLVRLDRSVLFEPGLVYSLQVVHLDGSVESRRVQVSGAYAAGDPVQLAAGLSQTPLEGSEWCVLREGTALKPFVCTGIALEDERQKLWRVNGIEYIAAVFDPDPDAVLDLPAYSTLADPATPPGPVLDLRVYERIINTVVPGPDGTPVVQAVNRVELAWNQTPADAERTATFRVYRRTVGTQSWIVLPEPKISRRSAVLEIVDLDRAYQFAVVAVSVFGAALSPDDPRVPKVTLSINSQEPPPAPPTDVELDQTTGNEYTLSWSAVPGAVEYQVLAGRADADQVNRAQFDAFQLARVAGTELGGLILTPGSPVTFAVRSVGLNGRLSLSIYRDRETPADPAIVTEASPAVPVGRSVVRTDSLATDVESSTLSNAAWVDDAVFNGQAQPGRFELVSAGSEGLVTGPEINLGSLADTELAYQLETANDADMPAVSADPLTRVPSTAADQWGVVQADREVGMIMPPYPATEHLYAVEVRTHDGSLWSSWSAWQPYTRLAGVIGRYQVRVRFARGAAPYRPAVRDLVVVVSR